MLDGGYETVDVLRKMQLIHDRYRSAEKTSALRPAIRKAHDSLFGFSVIEEAGKFHHTLERSRKGLIALENILSFLNLPIREDRLSDALLTCGGVDGQKWADAAAREWALKTETGQGWIPCPALRCFVKKVEPSTFRIVVLGLEAMALVRLRKTTRDYLPTKRDTATKSVTITHAGQALIEELAK